MKTRSGLGLLLLCCVAFSAPTFVTNPSMVKNGDDWQITFAVSESTDVEVSIVNVRDSGVVRHLAAGLLGYNPPAPLTANSLSQTLVWDGKDDFGRVAANPDSLSVRVRAGMTPRLANLAAEELYMFGVSGWHASATNILLDDDGGVLIFGHTSTAHFLRKYDPSGNYVKTLYPPPADLASESVTVFGINVVPGGGWAPRTTSSISPAITNSFLNNMSTQILPIGGPGEIVLVNGTDLQTMSKSGAIASATTRKLLTGPADPVYPLRLCGPQYYTASHNPSYLYLSGRYFGSLDGGCWLIDADTSGFWGDGQVFKVDRATGIASPWLKLDSVPVNKTERAAKLVGGANAFAAIHGVSIDDSLHVFVCDRVHRRISVYDTGAALLGSIACPSPDLVAVSNRTGYVYVLTRSDNEMRLLKFPSWRTPGSALASVLITTSIDGYTGTPALVLSETGGTTNIWLGYGYTGIRLYRDDGASFTLLRDFSAGARALCFDRVTVDRRTDKAYWSNSDNLLGVCNNINYSISDWSDPVAEVESTSTHAKLNIVDLTVAPNGLIYGYQNTYWAVPVERYTLDRLHAPVPYANTGLNVSTGLLGSETRRGLAVGWQGQIAVAAYGVSYDGVGGHDDNSIVLFPDTGCADTGDYGRAVVKHLSSKSSGVKFDAAGNLYVGTGIVSPDWRIKPGFESDNFYRNYSGSIVKFAPGDTGTVSGNTVTGASLVFPQPFGLYSGIGSGFCVCRSPRFDADPYGRLYIPNGAACNVVVADNAGNTIADIGQYGNTDSRGGLAGPGQLLADPAIPLAWPTSAAASEDYIYVSDIVNARIVRIRMEYAIDNIPGLTDYSVASKKGEAWKSLAMTALPNPFNPVSTIRVALPASGNLSLSVYDMNGRLVRTLAKGLKTAGIHGFEWNGNDQVGKSVAAGLYVYRLTAGNRVLTLKTVLAK